MKPLHKGLLAACVLPLLLATACRKSIAIDPPKNELTTETVFSDSSATLAALANLYVPFTRHGGAIESYFTSYTALYAGEIAPLGTSSTNVAEFYNSRLTPTNFINANIWSQLYRVVYGANDLLAGLEGSRGLSISFKNQAAGEALFLRAFSYFLLVNLYGDVPLVLQTEAKETARQPRTPQDAVYEQIMADLQEARGLLLPDYPGLERIRANRWAATALLARVQLYTGQWVDAVASAGEVIQASLYTPLEVPGAVFLKDSREAILQFWSRDGYTWSGAFLPAFGRPAFGLTPNLLAVFEAGDQRFSEWTRKESGGEAYYPYKYKNRTAALGSEAEYSVALRLGEQYLVRAEAYLRQGKTEEALQDINTVRQRAGLPALTPPITPDSLLALLQKERAAELFTEWGHRFFDLKRWGLADEVLGGVKPTWKPTAKWFPIPQGELLNNAALVQNAGY